MALHWKLILAGWVAYIPAAVVVLITGNLWLLGLYAVPLSLWAAGMIAVVRWGRAL